MPGQIEQTIYTFQELSIREALDRIYKTAINLNFPVAIWRLPLQEEVKLIVDLSGKAKKVAAELEALPDGFIIAPFETDEDHLADFISADLIFSSKGRELKVNPIFKDSWTTEMFFQGLNFSLKKGEDKSKFHDGKEKESVITTEQQSYLALVEKGISEIRNGGLKKVVLSKKRVINLPSDFDTLNTFMALTEAYPGAFINLYSLPGQGTWMGASPELLVSHDQNDIFKTVSLAGTQVAPDGSNPLEIGWTQKEIEEQAMVGRHVIDCFKKIRLREFIEEGPKTVRAANLYHLKSEYTVNTREVNFPQLATVMLKLLHPTSAVCGTPKDAALQFIKENEGYDRSYYSGYLGPVNIRNETTIFVNLRCMQLMKDQAVLYAGGGITEHSNPMKEWMETEMKCHTLLDVINP